MTVWGLDIGLGTRTVVHGTAGMEKMYVFVVTLVYICIYRACWAGILRNPLAANGFRSVLLVFFCRPWNFFFVYSSHGGF